jgi:L-lactate permease
MEIWITYLLSKHWEPRYAEHTQHNKNNNGEALRNRKELQRTITITMNWSPNFKVLTTLKHAASVSFSMMLKKNKESSCHHRGLRAKRKEKEVV